MEASGAIAAGAAGLILVVGGALVAVNRIRKTAGYNQAEQPSIPADERTALVARPVVA